LITDITAAGALKAAQAVVAAAVDKMRAAAKLSPVPRLSIEDNVKDDNVKDVFSFHISPVSLTVHVRQGIVHCLQRLL